MTIDAPITLNTITISAPITLGITGPPGPGVATGGTTGQVLAKASATDFDSEWVDANPFYGARISNSLNHTQTIPANVQTRLDSVFDVEDYDTNGVMDAANGRFQPDVAGYYNISAIWITTISGTGVQITSLHKNGVRYSVIGRVAIADGIVSGSGGSDTVYLNGGSDYVEIFVFQNSGSSVVTHANQGYQRFSATLTGE